MGGGFGWGGIGGGNGILSEDIWLGAFHTHMLIRTAFHASNTSSHCHVARWDGSRKEG